MSGYRIETCSNPLNQNLGGIWAVREGPAGESRAFHSPDQKPLTVRVLPMAAAVTETVPWTLDTFRPAMAFTAAPLTW